MLNALLYDPRWLRILGGRFVISVRGFARMVGAVKGRGRHRTVERHDYLSNSPANTCISKVKSHEDASAQRRRTGLAAGRVAAHPAGAVGAATGGHGPGRDAPGRDTHRTATGVSATAVSLFVRAMAMTRRRRGRRVRAAAGVRAERKRRAGRRSRAANRRRSTSGYGARGRPGGAALLPPAAAVIL